MFFLSYIFRFVPMSSYVTLSSIFPPNDKKICIADATLLTVFNTEITKEVDVSFTPNGAPSATIAILIWPSLNSKPMQKLMMLVHMEIHVDKPQQKFLRHSATSVIGGGSCWETCMVCSCFTCIAKQLAMSSAILILWYQ